MQTPRTDFAQAIHAIAQEHRVDPSAILDAVKQAMIAAYKRDAKERGELTEDFEYDVDLDPRSGEVRIFAYPAPKKADGQEIDEEEMEKLRKELMKDKKDVTPPGFGRIAAQTAKQIIHQKVREAEKGAIMQEYSGRVGTLISGVVLRFDGPDVRVDLGKTEGVMPKEERIPNEKLVPSQRLTFLVRGIVDSVRGKQIVLSRAAADFVQKLFEREVPEMAAKTVVVKAIAREPGIRTKIAVFSNQTGVDPVGSCVGQKGVRVQTVTNELGGERVDIIPWSEDTAQFIKSALTPAENLTVLLDEKTKTALVKAPEEELSLAIGRDGQNVSLAARLTNWKIKIKGEKTNSDADGKEKGKEKVETSTPADSQDSDESGSHTEKAMKDKQVEDGNLEKH
jgi:N utilization substance protein A